MATAPTVQLPVPSLYRSTPTYRTSDGLVVFGLLVPPILPDATDTVYTVTQGVDQRLDLIATSFYGNPALWWAIAIVNSVLDPWSDVPIGATLRIPTPQRVQSLLQ